jgi:prophage maintenance system killer protein
LERGGSVLNLQAIEASLRDVQAQFPRINAILKSRRDSMDDAIVERMLLGYAFVDDLLARKVDLFSLAEKDGGIRDIIEWYDMHAKESAWKRAAGVYIRVLSEPELFIEGNHRTGALIMSYILARDGYPPFVLTVDNAQAYFDPSTLITKKKKKSLTLLLEMPRLKRQFAEFLTSQENPKYLQCPRA